MATGAPRVDVAAPGTWTDRQLALAMLAVLAMLIVSGWRPYDRATWLLEVLPVVLVLPLLVYTRRRFPLTGLLYTGLCVHAAVLILGGAYTYARVPLGDVLKDLFDLERNPYDRIGHLFQGFVPALAAREILLRGGHVRSRAWVPFLVVCIVLAFSATYELIEWATAVVFADGAVAFLGTQGDPWDAQWDMFCALLGGLAALAGCSRFHDRELMILAPRATATTDAHDVRAG